MTSEKYAWWHRLWARIGLHRSLFGRLLTAYTGLAVVGMVIIGLLLSYLAGGYIRDQRMEELNRVARRVGHLVRQVAADNEEQALSRDLAALIPFIGDTLNVGIGLFDTQGSVVAVSSDGEAVLGTTVPENILTAVMEQKIVNDIMRLDDKGSGYLVAVAPVGDADQIFGGVLVYTPEQDVQHAVTRIRETILWVALAVLLVSIGVGSYISWSISRPLRDIRRIVDNIGAGNYQTQSLQGPAGDDEIGELASAIVALGKQLAAAERQRSQAEESRRRLFADVSHELRTPLTTMRGFTEALLDELDDNPGTRRRYLQLIHEQALHLGRLVDDLMRLSRLEAGDIRLVRMPVDLVGLVKNVADRFRPVAQRQDVQIDVVAGNDAAIVIGDPDRLEQIVTNLLANAIDVSAGGRVQLGIINHHSDTVRLEVADTGPGIDPADLPYVWERFYRGNKRCGQGSGLGLAIVRRLVELHNGSVSVETHPGEGTRFLVNFPRARLQ